MNRESLQYVRKVVSWEREDTGLLLNCWTQDGLNVGIRLDICTPEIWRLRMGSLHAMASRRSYLVVKEQWPSTSFQVEERPNGIALRTGKQVVRIQKKTWLLSVLDLDGKLVCCENPGDVDGLGRLNIKPLGFSLDEEGRVRNVFETFYLQADEHFYGFGEKFTPLDKRGQELVSWNVDALGTTTERAYKNIPFFMSTRGYGLFLNTTCRIFYHMGTKSCISYTFEVEEDCLDFYFILGPRFSDILARYTELTGRAPVPPKWSFGLWVSSTGTYRTREAMEALADGLRERDIPCDVLHIDPWWMRPRKYCDFQWNQEAFPNPEEMIADLKAKGFKISLWEQPYISRESELYQEAKDLGYLVLREYGSVYEIDYGLSLAPLPGGELGLAAPGASWNAPVAIVDFSKPAAAHWWQEKHKPLFNAGIDVFKTDFGEDVPEDARFYNGMTGREMHNLFPLLYNRAVFEASEAFTGRPGLVWGRSGYAGSQRYPTHWAGDPAADFGSLACVIRGGLSFGLSGCPFWSHDIGGYRGTPSEELYIRWAQFGLFSPHARCHGETAREPWRFGERTLDIFRFYAKLRYRLIPYIYSYAHVAYRTGLPLMRAMILECPGDPNVYDKDLQYFFGREFLVAPIYSETGQRYVYLPQGRWLDYWSQEEYEGPINIWYKASLEILPLFVRAGAIIPMGPEMSYVGEKPFDPITLDIYPYGHSEFTLYDEEETTTFACHRAGGGITFEIGPSKKTYILKFNKTDHPMCVEANGGALAAHDTQANFERSTEGWWWDPIGRLFIKIRPSREKLVIGILTIE